MPSGKTKAPRGTVPSIHGTGTVGMETGEPQAATQRATVVAGWATAALGACPAGAQADRVPAIHTQRPEKVPCSGWVRQCFPGLQ